MCQLGGIEVSTVGIFLLLALLLGDRAVRICLDALAKLRLTDEVRNCVDVRSHVGSRAVRADAAEGECGLERLDRGIEEEEQVIYRVTGVGIGHTTANVGAGVPLGGAPGGCRVG